MVLISFKYSFPLFGSIRKSTRASPEQSTAWNALMAISCTCLHLFLADFCRDHRLRTFVNVLGVVIIKFRCRHNLADGRCLRLIVAQHRALQFARFVLFPANALLDHNLAVVFGRLFNSRSQFLTIMRFGNADRRSKVRRLNKYRVLQIAFQPAL